MQPVFGLQLPVVHRSLLRLPHLRASPSKESVMKMSEFILLDERAKANAVLCQGVLVAKQKEIPLIHFLFQMDTFYVSLCCDTRDKQVKEYRAFTDTHQLQPFLDQIPLTGLI